MYGTCLLVDILLRLSIRILRKFISTCELDLTYTAKSA